MMTDEEIRKILADVVASDKQGEGENEVAPAHVEYIIPVHYFSIILFAGEGWRSSKPSFFAGRPLQYEEMLVKILCPCPDSIKASKIDVPNFLSFKNCSWIKYFRFTGTYCGFNVPMTEIFEIIRYCDQIGRIMAFI